MTHFVLYPQIVPSQLRAKAGTWEVMGTMTKCRVEALRTLALHLETQTGLTWSVPLGGERAGGVSTTIEGRKYIVVLASQPI